MSTNLSGQWIALTAADGHRFDAFTVAPAAAVKGTVVLLPEIFGVNGHIQSVATDLARLGYAAIAPALFDRVQQKVNLGYDKDGVEQGIRLKSAVPVEHALLDVAAALAHAGEARSAVVLQAVELAPRLRLAPFADRAHHRAKTFMGEPDAEAARSD